MNFGGGAGPIYAGILFSKDAGEGGFGVVLGDGRDGAVGETGEGFDTECGAEGR
jgi:hypothetical protein